jgi:NADH-quinone oxidoreductase subunit G
MFKNKLVPIGALTSKPYAFVARSWELKSYEYIDFLDGLCSTIRLDMQNNEVVRILPTKTEGLNEDWITDKVRFLCDGLYRQRINISYVRENNIKANILKPISWLESLGKLVEQLNLNKDFVVEGLCGQMIDLETQLVFRDCLLSVGSSNFEIRTDGSKIDLDVKDDFLCNTLPEDLEKSDLIGLIGADLRLEYPLLNVRVIKALQFKNCLIGTVGFFVSVNYENKNYGNSLLDILSLVEGKSLFSSIMVRSQNVNLLLGRSLLQRCDYLSIVINYLKSYFLRIDKILSVNILQGTAGISGALMLGGVNWHSELFNRSLQGKWLYLLGADEVESQKGLMSFFDYDFLIYQGSHGDKNAEFADIILPGVMPLEKQGSFLNIFGSKVAYKFLINPLGESRVDWKILAVVFKIVLHEIGNENSVFTNISYKVIEKRLNKWLGNCVNKFVKDRRYFIKEEVGKFGNVGLSSYVDNFYMTDAITRNSIVLALIKKQYEKFITIWQC